MEEFDDLVPTPSEDGSLELTYRGWTEIDDVIWTMGRELILLNVSFNAITDLPPELGDLQLLRNLNLSCNKLSAIPKQIGKLKNLEILRINGNQIMHLPQEIGDCVRLEKLYAGENKLQSFPDTVVNLKCLTYLQLTNNDLVSFPPAICQSTKIEEIDLGNNPGLTKMIPNTLQGNTEYILWTCDKWYHHDAQVNLIKGCNDDHTRIIESGNTKAKGLMESVEKVIADKRDFLEEMPTGCCLKVAKCCSSCNRCCNSCSVM